MSTSISIPSRNVAANYAASFRPVSVAPGFSQVKSDLAANYLMQVPMLRQKMEMDLAKSALAQAATLEGLDRKIDAQKYALDLAVEQNKREAIMGMLGQEEQAPYTIPPVSYLNSLTKSDDALIKALREQKAQSGASTQLPAVGGVDFEKWSSPEMVKALGGLSVDEYLKATTTEDQATPAAKVETKGTTFFTTP